MAPFGRAILLRRELRRLLADQLRSFFVRVSFSLSVLDDVRHRRCLLFLSRAPMAELTTVPTNQPHAPSSMSPVSTLRATSAFLSLSETSGRQRAGRI